MAGQRKMAVEIARGDNSSSKFALRCSARRHNKPPAAAARIHSRANFLASLGEYGERMCLYGEGKGGWGGKRENTCRRNRPGGGDGIYSAPGLVVDGEERL